MPFPEPKFRTYFWTQIKSNFCVHPSFTLDVVQQLLLRWARKHTCICAAQLAVPAAETFHSAPKRSPHTLQHTKSGNVSLLGCTVHWMHTRLSAGIATHSGGCPLLEYINNVNKLCFLGSQPRGIILLGDSAGAHFHIPPEWLTASQMSSVSNWGSTHSGCAGLCFCSLCS